MNEAIKNRIELVRRGEVPEGYRLFNGRTLPADWNTCLLEKRFQRLLRRNQTNCLNVLTISAQQGLVCQRDFFNQEVASEDKSGYFLLKKGDFAYNKSYSEGYPLGAIKRLETLEDGVVSPLYICFSPKEQTNSDYYTHYFEAGEYNHEIYRVAQEGARNHGLLNISVEDFFKGTIVDPPPPEQQKIAEILACCDQVIALKKQLLDVKRREKQWLMKKILDPDSGVRLPSFENSVWKKRLVSSCGKWTGGGTPSKQNKTFWKNGTIKWISSQDVKARKTQNTTHTITRAAVTASATNLVPPGSIIIVARSGILKRKFPVSYIEETMAINQDIKALIPKADIYGLFILSWIEANENRLLKDYVKTGTTVQSLMFDQFLGIEIMIPSVEEQRAISNILECFNRDIDLLDQELFQWQQKKKSLMQLLLKGIVRVNV